MEDRSVSRNWTMEYLTTREGRRRNVVGRLPFKYLLDKVVGAQSLSQLAWEVNQEEQVVQDRLDMLTTDELGTLLAQIKKPSESRVRRSQAEALQSWWDRLTEADRKAAIDAVWPDETARGRLPDRFRVGMQSAGVVIVDAWFTDGGGPAVTDFAVPANVHDFLVRQIL